MLQELIHTMKRRKFTKSSSLALASIAFLKCKTDNAVKEIKEELNPEQLQGLDDFGLQLWSVRDDMKKNPKQTLKAIADIGYDDIEVAGYESGKYYGMSPEEFKMILSDLGLKVRSTHTNTGRFIPDVSGTMTNGWEKVLEDAKIIGVQSIVCGWLHEDFRKTMDDYKRTAELFNRCGEAANSYGLKFGFHNHDFEFFDIEGERPYDLLLTQTDPDKCFFELDHYWIKKGGQDSIEYMNKYKGRFPVWHVKDMDNTSKQFFTEVGTGIIDYKEIFKNQSLGELKYFYVEQDEFKSLKPLESVKKSHDYLASTKMG